MTGDLEKFLRSTERKPASHFEETRTNPGIGPGGWNSKALSNAQGQSGKPDALFKTKTVYRLYTEDKNRNATIATIKRYFDGATLHYGIGLDARTQSTDENAVVIEIVTSKPDALQQIAYLACDLRAMNDQISILVTRATVDTFEVTE